MKRSAQVRLLLLGGLSAGALAGCSRDTREPRVSPESVYTNDYHIDGVGYYHAPYHAFYAKPYNFFDPQRGYYYGGSWHAAPDRSVINISAPTMDAARAAEAARAALVQRGGFGSTSGSHHIWS